MNIPMNRRRLLALAGVGVAGLRPWPAQAQALELTRVVLGFPAGSSIDATARRAADKLTPGYARTAVVDNRVGGGGQVAVVAMKSLAPDGASLLLTPMSILGVYPHTYKKLPYDPIADLTPVSIGVSFDYGFAVGTAVPESVRTIPEFMHWAKGERTRSSIGSPATGSTLHFTGIMLGRAAGLDVTHVGYRGSQAAVQDLIGGQLPALVGPLGEFIRHMPGGKVRVLGTSGARRSRFTPQIATFVEQGYREMAMSEWFGFYLPARAGNDVVQRANAAIREALSAPDVAEGLAPFGLECTPSTPQQLAQTLKADTERWGPIVKAVGFTADN